MTTARPRARSIRTWRTRRPSAPEQGPNNDTCGAWSAALFSKIGELAAFLVWGISGGAVPLPLVVMQVLAIDLGTNQLPAMALGAERASPAR